MNRSDVKECLVNMNTDLFWLVTKILAAFLFIGVVIALIGPWVSFLIDCYFDWTQLKIKQMTVTRMYKNQMKLAKTLKPNKTEE